MGAFLRVPTSSVADCNDRTSKLACRGLLLQDDIVRQHDMSKMRILPFVDRFPKDLELYKIMTTRLSEVQEAKETKEQ